jgi:NADPH-dependent curcumin reductase CurA
MGQLAKREGLRVIGSVGADNKLNFIVEELNCDGDSITRSRIQPML